MADEKFDEKEMEKREEKAPEEKSWEEKWRRDPLSSIVWAAIFIWAGVVLLASNLGYLDRLQARGVDIPGLGGVLRVEAWSVIFLGAGMIVLLEAVVRLLMPEYRRQIGGTLFFAAILIGIGLNNLFGWSLVWPLILIALGLSVILRGVFRERS
ncbi:MAG TPA: hypothetical protein VLA49_10770 [Anaerolineales bacterium]|nr:hypothetical protein [Anaerolineales bacterium]